MVAIFEEATKLSDKTASHYKDSHLNHSLADDAVWTDGDSATNITELHFNRPTQTSTVWKQQQGRKEKKKRQLIKWL